ncbi:hypothetical protein MKW92_038913 [Papaver armeniacum]|nr:hypothetical protein MKW92_038913 [Papaver armeniacum]
MMNKLKGLISTPRLPSSAGNFNRGTLLLNGMGRDSPECVFCKSTRAGKFQVKDKDLGSEDTMSRLFKVFNEKVKNGRSTFMSSDMTLKEAIRTCTGYGPYSHDFPGKMRYQRNGEPTPWERVSKKIMERGGLGCEDAAKSCTCYGRSNERCGYRRMRQSGEATPWERLSKKIMGRGGSGCDDASQLVGNKAWCTCYARSNERRNYCGRFR